MLLALSLAPFALFLYLLFYKKQPLFTVSAATLGLFVYLVVIIWQISSQAFFISFGKGFFVAWDIFLIIFGALLFLTIIQQAKVIERIIAYINTLSADYRVKTILLAWLLENFLEGTAGFGTPAAVVAPLLVGLGFTPFKAVTIALLGNSTAGIFGAAGTPIRVGFGGIQPEGLVTTAAAYGFVGFIIPIFILLAAVSGRRRSQEEFQTALPFALFCGLAYVVPVFLVSFLGNEFPTIIGSLFGLFLTVIVIKLRLFIPRVNRQLIETPSPKRALLTPACCLPYLILIIMLFIGKWFLSGYVIQIPLLNHQLSFNNPGLAFISAAIISLLLLKIPFTSLSAVARLSAKKALEPFLVVICTSTLVQLLVNSAQNTSGLPSALTYLASILQGPLLPLLTPFIGAFGSFLTGSVTISNLMFGNMLNLSAIKTGFNVTHILAIQVAAAATANMIALADMLAAQAVVGIKNQERAILKGVIVPCLVCLIIIGVIGLLLAS